MKVRVISTTSMMNAFGVKIGDEYEVIKSLKGKDEDEETATYKYLVRFPKTDSIVGLFSKYVEETSS